MIEKFLTQEETHKNLQQLTRDSQERIEQLYAQRRKADETLQRLRYTSSKPAPSRRPARALAPAGEGVSAAQSKYERMRNKHEHMKAVFLSVRAGIGNLARQLDADRMLDKLPLEEMGAREMAALLDEAGARAGALLGAIEMEEEAMRAAASTVAAASAQPAQAAKVSASELELGPGNIRIKDPTERDDDAQEGETPSPRPHPRAPPRARASPALLPRARRARTAVPPPHASSTSHRRRRCRRLALRLCLPP